MNETGRKIQYSISGSKNKHSLERYGEEVPIVFPNLDNNHGKISNELIMTLIKKYKINFFVEGIDQVINKLPLNRIGTFLIPASDNKSLVYETKMKSGSRVCILRSPITIQNKCKHLYFLFVLFYLNTFLFSSWISNRCNFEGCYF